MNVDKASTTKSKPSRIRVLLKLGCVFTAGLLLAMVQFGPSSLWDVLYWCTEPFTSWKLFAGDGVASLWFSLAALMLLIAALSILTKRLLWLAYLNIGAYWLYTYARLAISF